MQYYIQIFFFWRNSTIKIAKPLLVASTLNEDSLQNISNYDITKGILPHIGFPWHRHIFWTASYWVGIKTNSPWHGYNHATYRLMPAHKTATLLIVAQPLNIPPHWIYFNNTIIKVKNPFYHTLNHTTSGGTPAHIEIPFYQQKQCTDDCFVVVKLMIIHHRCQ